MFEPSDEQSRKNRELVRQAFMKRIADPAPYTIAYGYSMNDMVLENTIGEALGRILGAILRSITGQKTSNFVVAFSENLKELIIGLVQQPGWLSHKPRRFGEFLVEIRQICCFLAEVVQ